MTIIAQSFERSIHDLQDLAALPPVEAVRPPACPNCGAAAGVPGALNLIGHGTYRRQVLGLADSPTLVIAVRRVLCRACRRTTSVLPDELHPRRWYAGAAILLAVVLSLLRGQAADDVRRAVGGQSETRRWRTLERWKRQLLAPLWRWHASELGFAKHPERADGATRLRRLLARIGTCERSPPDELAAAARAALRGTAHTRETSWHFAPAH